MTQAVDEGVQGNLLRMAQHCAAPGGVDVYAKQGPQLRHVASGDVGTPYKLVREHVVGHACAAWSAKHPTEPINVDEVARACLVPLWCTKFEPYPKRAWGHCMSFRVEGGGEKEAHVIALLLFISHANAW